MNKLPFRDAPAYLYLAGLLANPWRSPGTIRRRQEWRLKALLQHAYDHVPYYRTLFEEARIKPQDVRTLDDLVHVPMTSKAQLCDLSDRERAARNVDLARCQSFSTSGATGIPLRSCFTRRDALIRNLAWIRSYLHCGVSPFLKTAAFVGRRDIRTANSWYEHLGLWRRREISAWETPHSWVKDLRQWRPQVYQGYVMTLRLLAEHIQENNVLDLRPRFVLHSSALLDEASRQTLESALGCRVIDFYGSDEAGCLAWECPVCRGYHICSDTVILEVLNNGKPARPGEDGEVVITSLHSWAMPFIRYRQDDIVAMSSRVPSCGRRFPLLDNIQGRQDDFVVLPGGRKLSPHVFYSVLDFVPGIRRWRVTQDGARRLGVEVVRGAGFNPSSLKAIEANLRRIVQNELKIDIMPVASLHVEGGRKFRAVSSALGGSAR